MIIGGHKVEKKDFSKLLLLFSFLFLIFFFVNRDNIFDYANILYNDSVFLVKTKTDPPKFYINLKPNDYILLQKERKSLIRNNLISEFGRYDSKIIEDDITIKSQISLASKNKNKYYGHNFIPLKIKYNGGVGYDKKEDIIVKESHDQIAKKKLFNFYYKKLFSGIEVKNQITKVILNKSNLGFFNKIDYLDTYLIENNFQRESFFLKIDSKLNFINVSEELQGDYLQLFKLSLENDFINLIDQQKLNGFLSLFNFFFEIDIQELSEFIWYFNPITGLLEPILFYEDYIDNILEISNENEVRFKNNFKTLINNQISNRISFSHLDDIKNYKRVFSKKTLNIIEGDRLISEDLILTEKDSVIIRNFNEIIFSNNAGIINYGGYLKIKGKKNGSKIISEDNSNSFLFSVNSEVEVDNISFNGFSSPKRDIWILPSSFTFYESIVSIENSDFESNRSGDDMINFFRCEEVTVKNCLFNNVLSDAVDSDFSKIKIINSSFNFIGNDAIDGSGSNILVDKCKFSYVQDKVISAGENSYIRTLSNQIESSELGLTVKDGSILESERDFFSQNRFDVVMFNKKKYFKAPFLRLKNSNATSNLLENNSKIEGLLGIKRFEKDVEKLLYGRVYGKASK